MKRKLQLKKVNVRLISDPSIIEGGATLKGGSCNFCTISCQTCQTCASVCTCAATTCAGTG